MLDSSEKTLDDAEAALVTWCICCCIISEETDDDELTVAVIMDELSCTVRTCSTILERSRGKVIG